MDFSVTVNEAGATPRLLLRQANALARQVGGQVGAHWQHFLLPKHFTHAGATEYHYQPRTTKYMIRKFKKTGHTYPLFFSGDSMLALVGHNQPGMPSTIVPDVRVTATGGTARIRVVLAGANKLNFRRTPDAPDLRKEVTTVSEGDARELLNYAATQFQVGAQALRDSSQRQI